MLDVVALGAFAAGQAPAALLARRRASRHHLVRRAAVAHGGLDKSKPRAVANAYSLLKTIMETAVTDDLIPAARPALPAATGRSRPSARAQGGGT